MADYRPKQAAAEKIKKTEGNNQNKLEIELEKTDDILAFLGEHKKQNQFLCGFSMETQNVIENSRKKLYRKKLDMIAANSLKEAGAGFAGDTNIITLITPSYEKKLELMTNSDSYRQAAPSQRQRDRKSVV